MRREGLREQAASRHVSDARHESRRCLYIIEQPLYFSSPALVVKLVDTLS
jgi:hypothetical protein